MRNRSLLEAITDGRLLDVIVNLGGSHVCAFDAGGPTVAGSDTGIGAWGGDAPSWGGGSPDDPAGTGGTNDTTGGPGTSSPGGGDTWSLMSPESVAASTGMSLADAYATQGLDIPSGMDLSSTYVSDDSPWAGVPYSADVQFGPDTYSFSLGPSTPGGVAVDLGSYSDAIQFGQNNPGISGFNLNPDVPINTQRGGTQYWTGQTWYDTLTHENWTMDNQNLGIMDYGGKSGSDFSSSLTPNSVLGALTSLGLQFGGLPHGIANVIGNFAGHSISQSTLGGLSSTTSGQSININPGIQIGEWRGGNEIWTGQAWVNNATGAYWDSKGEWHEGPANWTPGSLSFYGNSFTTYPGFVPGQPYTPSTSLSPTQNMMTTIPDRLEQGLTIGKGLDEPVAITLYDQDGSPKGFETYEANFFDMPDSTGAVPGTLGYIVGHPVITTMPDGKTAFHQWEGPGMLVPDMYPGYMPHVTYDVMITPSLFSGDYHNDLDNTAFLENLVGEINAGTWGYGQAGYVAPVYDQYGPTGSYTPCTAKGLPFIYDKMPDIKDPISIVKDAQGNIIPLTEARLVAFKTDDPHVIQWGPYTLNSLQGNWMQATPGSPVYIALVMGPDGVVPTYISGDQKEAIEAASSVPSSSQSQLTTEPSSGFLALESNPDPTPTPGFSLAGDTSPWAVGFNTSNIFGANLYQYEDVRVVGTPSNYGIAINPFEEYSSRAVLSPAAINDSIRAYGGVLMGSLDMGARTNLSSSGRLFSINSSGEFKYFGELLNQEGQSTGWALHTDKSGYPVGVLSNLGYMNVSLPEAPLYLMGGTGGQGEFAGASIDKLTIQPSGALNFGLWTQESPGGNLFGRYVTGQIDQGPSGWEYRELTPGTQISVAAPGPVPNVQAGTPIPGPAPTPALTTLATVPDLSSLFSEDKSREALVQSMLLSPVGRGQLAMASVSALVEQNQPKGVTTDSSPIIRNPFIDKINEAPRTADVVQNLVDRFSKDPGYVGNQPQLALENAGIPRTDWSWQALVWVQDWAPGQYENLEELGAPSTHQEWVPVGKMGSPEWHEAEAQYGKITADSIKLDAASTMADLSGDQRLATLSNYTPGPTGWDYAKEIGLGLIPVYGTVRNWDNMSTGWRALSIMGDLLFLIPIAELASGGAKLGARAIAGLGTKEVGPFIEHTAMYSPNAAARVPNSFAGITRPVSTSLNVVSKAISPSEIARGTRLADLFNQPIFGKLNLPPQVNEVRVSQSLFKEAVEEAAERGVGDATGLSTVTSKAPSELKLVVSEVGRTRIGQFASSTLDKLSSWIGANALSMSFGRPGTIGHPVSTVGLRLDLQDAATGKILPTQRSTAFRVGPITLATSTDLKQAPRVSFSLKSGSISKGPLVSTVTPGPSLTSQAWTSTKTNLAEGFGNLRQGKLKEGFTGVGQGLSDVLKPGTYFTVKNTPHVQESLRIAQELQKLGSIMGATKSTHVEPSILMHSLGTYSEALRRFPNDYTVQFAALVHDLGKASSEMRISKVLEEVDPEIASKIEQVLYKGQFDRPEQIKIVRSQLSPTSQKVFDDYLELVDRIKSGPTVPSAFLVKTPEEALQYIEGMPNIPDLREAVVKALRDYNIAVGGSTSEQAYLHPDVERILSGDFDGYALNGNKAEVAGALSQTITTKLNDMGFRVRSTWKEGDSNFEITTYRLLEDGEPGDTLASVAGVGEKTSVGEVQPVSVSFSIHNLGEFEKSLPFNMKEDSFFDIQGVKFLDPRSQVGRRVKTQIVPTSEGTLGLAYEGRAKDAEKLSHLMDSYIKDISSTGTNTAYADNLKAIWDRIQNAEEVPNEKGMSLLVSSRGHAEESAKFLENLGVPDKVVDLVRLHGARKDQWDQVFAEKPSLANDLAALQECDHFGRGHTPKIEVTTEYLEKLVSKLWERTPDIEPSVGLIASERPRVLSPIMQYGTRVGWDFRLPWDRERSFGLGYSGIRQVPWSELPNEYVVGGTRPEYYSFGSPQAMRRAGYTPGTISAIHETRPHILRAHTLSEVHDFSKVPVMGTRYLTEPQAGVVYKVLEGWVGKIDANFGSSVLHFMLDKDLRAWRSVGDIEVLMLDKADVTPITNQIYQALKETMGDKVVMKGDHSIVMAGENGGKIFEAKVREKGDKYTNTTGAYGIPYTGRYVDVTFVQGMSKPVSTKTLNELANRLYALQDSRYVYSTVPRDHLSIALEAYEKVKELAPDNPELQLAALLSSVGEIVPVKSSARSNSYLPIRSLLEASERGANKEGGKSYVQFMQKGKFNTEQNLLYLRSITNPETKQGLTHLDNMLGILHNTPEVPSDRIVLTPAEALVGINGVTPAVAEALARGFSGTDTLLEGSTITKFFNRGNTVPVHLSNDIEFRSEVGPTVLAKIRSELEKLPPSEGVQVRTGAAGANSRTLWVTLPGRNTDLEIVAHLPDQFEQAIPFGFVKNQIVVDGINVTDLKFQIGNKIDAIIRPWVKEVDLDEFSNLGGLAAKGSWAPDKGRLKDIGYLKEDLSVYAEGLKSLGLDKEAKELLTEYEGFVSGLQVGRPLGEYKVSGTNTKFIDYIKKNPDTQLIAGKAIGDNFGPKVQWYVENANKKLGAVLGHTSEVDIQHLKLLQQALLDSRVSKEPLSKTSLSDIKTLLKEASDKISTSKYTVPVMDPGEVATRLFSQIAETKGGLVEQAVPGAGWGNKAFNAQIQSLGHREKAYADAFALIWTLAASERHSIDSGLEVALTWARTVGYDPTSVLRNVHKGEVLPVSLKVELPTLLEETRPLANAAGKSGSKSAVPETTLDRAVKDLAVTGQIPEGRSVVVDTIESKDLGSVGSSLVDRTVERPTSRSVSQEASGIDSPRVPETVSPDIYAVSREGTYTPMASSFSRGYGGYSITKGYSGYGTRGAYPGYRASYGYQSKYSPYSTPYTPKGSYAGSYSPYSPYGQYGQYGQYGVYGPYSPYSSNKFGGFSSYSMGGYKITPPPLPGKNKGGGGGKKKKADSKKKVILETKPVPWNVGETTPPGVTPWELNQVAKIEAIPLKEGWRFNHWEGDIPMVDSTKNPTTVLMFKDRKCRAIFTKGPTVKMVDMGPNNIQVFLPKVTYKENVLTERDVFNLGGKERPLTRRNPAAYGEPRVKEMGFDTSRYIMNTPVNKNLHPEVTRV